MVCLYNQTIRFCFDQSLHTQKRMERTTGIEPHHPINIFMEDFNKKCSCIYCRQTFCKKNVYRHYIRLHQEVSVNENAFRSFTVIVEKQKYCPGCGVESKNKFCSLSCSTTFYNKKRKHTESTRNKISKSVKSLRPVKKLIECEECADTFYKKKRGKERFCSAACRETSRSKKLSQKNRERMDLGWNPQEHRNRSKPSYLEKSFENWLVKQNFSDYKRNKTFRCGKKVYYGDFFFPSKNVLIELDGQQHKKNTEYDNERDNNIEKYFSVKTLRISYDEYFKKTKIEEVKSAIGIK